MSNKPRILAAYRELLSLIRRMPSHQQAQALAESRTTMRQHAGEADQARQSELFKHLAAKISFLRIITPKQPGDTSSIGAGHFVFRKGELVEGVGTSAGTRVADGTISISEAHEKHQQLLKRQHFGRAPPAYDPSTF